LRFSSDTFFFNAAESQEFIVFAFVECFKDFVNDFGSICGFPEELEFVLALCCKLFCCIWISQIGSLAQTLQYQEWFQLLLHIPQIVLVFVWAASQMWFNYDQRCFVSDI
jgi:hypothetical protein